MSVGKGLASGHPDVKVSGGDGVGPSGHQGVSSYLTVTLLLGKQEGRRVTGVHLAVSSRVT